MRILFRTLVLACLGLTYFTVSGDFEEVWSEPKGKLVVAQGGDATTLDPHMHSENFTFAIVRQVYDHLMNRVFKDGKIQHFPMLATSWEATNDTTWVFHLRKGVKFHNGEDFNAEAVKYSIERVLNPTQKARWRYAFTFIDRVEIVDPYTIKIITKGPAPALLINLGFAMPIVPPGYFKEKGDAYISTRPVGTGPFKFVRWVKDEEVVFEANENYWAGPPKVKTLVFKPIREDSTRIAALMGGDVDIAKKVPTHLIPMVNKSGRTKIMMAPSALAINLILDTKKGPLQDKRVRQALNYGVDKESILQHVLEGYGKPLATPISPANFGYDPNIKPYPYDPEKAKALLKEAGYGGGLTLTFSSPSGRYDKDKEFAEAIVGQLAKVGINVRLEVLEWGNYQAKIFASGIGDIHSVGWGGTFDADGTLYPLLHCNGIRSKWCNKQFDSVLEQAQATLNEKRREELYSQACKLAHDEAAMLFLHYGMDTYGVSNRVQNWSPTSCESTSLYMYGISVKD